MTKETSTNPAPRAYASDLNLVLLGTMNLNVDAVPARRPAARVELKTIHPFRDDPTQLPQVYWDEETNEHFVLGEMARARLVDGVLHRVSDEELEALKTPLLPPGEATVTPYAASEIENCTKPGGTLYWLRPRKGKSKKVLDSAAKVYALFVDAIAASEFAWVTEMTMRDQQKMFRLISWQGCLALQELIRPGEFQHIEATTFDYDVRLLDAVDKAAAAHLHEFNPDEFLNFYRDRAADLDEAKRTGQPIDVAIATKPAPDASDDDALLAMLSASVAEVRKAS